MNRPARTIEGMTLANPAALIAWAINTGRIRAADGPLWLNRITGTGRNAWIDQLLDARPGTLVVPKVPTP